MKSVALITIGRRCYKVAYEVFDVKVLGRS